MIKLRDKAIAGASWSLAGRLMQQAGQFIIGIVMARLLAPAEYGMVAMSTVFITLTYVFVDSGFGIAIIQRKEIRNVDLSTVFYSNLSVSFVIFLAFILTAPLIGKFYGKPELTEIVRVLAFLILLHAFSIVQNAKIVRDLKFKLRTTIEFSSQIISGIVGIYLAYSGFGVWALVWKTILNQLLINIQLWTRNRWLPGIEFSVTSLKEMFGFSSKLLLSAILDKIHNQIMTIIIGKFYPSKELGLYSRADQFQQLPSQSISGAILNFLLPVFSKMQDEPTRFKNALQKVIQLIMYFNIPAMVWIALSAKPLIILLLGEKWIGTVDYLQLLIFSGILYPMQLINVQVLTALGRSDLFLKIEVIKKVIFIPAVLLAIFVGIKSMIIAMILGSILTLYINTFYTSKLIKFGFIEQVFSLKNSIIITLIMSIVLSALSFFVDLLALSTVQHLILLSFGALASLFISAKLLNHFEYNELINIVTTQIRKDR